MTKKEILNDKKCFVIMPFSDGGSYPKGHFKRVYEYIIKPACEKAGFQAVRGDDVTKTNFIALDILKNILQADIAICDLSSKSPNVFYELGLRQAFNLPVTLIKDESTERIFDIQGFRDIVYDENLRVDTVNLAIDDISKGLISTYKSSQSTNPDVNSLVQLLGIKPAKIEDIHLSKESSLILNSIRTIEKRLAYIESKTGPSRFSVSQKLMSELLETVDYKCQNCGKELDMNLAQIRHVIPKGIGEELLNQNLEILCQSCNVNMKNL
ncbi:HNH endonuclease [Bacillus sp. 16GRE42]|uniref:HNH endonuclease n=1 Tax=Bacillus sp. 16GRE42 TaxID=2778092 RepID=UPI001C9AFAB0|nr:HNH endonuclease [Bacillus sp. 16GRE42]MBY7125745.1 HNH endonuclease [Bacillus sp. 16GRE42]